jgi:hypothetical protein
MNAARVSGSHATIRYACLQIDNELCKVIRVATN